MSREVEHYCFKSDSALGACQFQCENCANQVTLEARNAKIKELQAENAELRKLLTVLDDGGSKVLTLAQRQIVQLEKQNFIRKLQAENAELRKVVEILFDQAHPVQADSMGWKEKAMAEWIEAIKTTDQ